MGAMTLPTANEVPPPPPSPCVSPYQQTHRCHYCTLPLVRGDAYINRFMLNARGERERGKGENARRLDLKDTHALFAVHDTMQARASGRRGPVAAKCHCARCPGEARQAFCACAVACDKREQTPGCNAIRAAAHARGVSCRTLQRRIMSTPTVGVGVVVVDVVDKVGRKPECPIIGCICAGPALQHVAMVPTLGNEIFR